MIPIPSFSDESWYLHQIKKLFLHGNVSERNVERYFREQMEPKLIPLISGVLSADGLSQVTAGETLFDKLILAPFPILKRLYKKFEDREFQKEVVKAGRKVWVVKDEWRIFCTAYEKLVRNHVNTDLVDRYGIKCCPYCNENYVFNRGDKASAQLDHFFPKEIYPLMAVSLYNLVPSCPSCNHVKLEQILGVSPHDRQRDFDSMRITYMPKAANWIMDYHDLEILFKFADSDKDRGFARDMKKNLDRLKLKEAYQNHRDYVQEIVNKAFWYNEAGEKVLNNSLSGLWKSKEEMLRLVFGNYVEPKDFLKRPLSKLTRDILLELGIL